MNFFNRIHKFVVALIFLLVLTTTTACASVSSTETAQLPAASNQQVYAQIERGNTPTGQKFADWAVQKSGGLIGDAYVRDNNKLGVVITPQVQPRDVRPLAKSLAQGFHRNFANQDVTVLIYAPDKKLILTAKYDQQSNQIQYQ